MALIRLLALEDRISSLILRLVLMPVVLGALVKPSSAYAQPSLQHVVLTYSSRSIASIDLFIAQERGFFREEGLDAQLVQVRATAAIAAIISGEVNALGSIGSAIRAIPRARRSKF
jgi:ABC-type nitrate/sulfonate/bicarbonate transport system substrate-binding protein